VRGPAVLRENLYATLMLDVVASLCVAWLTMMMSLIADLFPSSIREYYPTKLHILKLISDNNCTAIKKVKRVLLMTAMPVWTSSPNFGHLLN